MSRTRVSRLAASGIALIVGLSGCDSSIRMPTSTDGGTGNGAGHTGITTTGPSHVRIALSDTLFRSIGDSLLATARVTDATGATISSAVPAWISTQPGIVALGTQAGLTIAQAPGVSLLIASYAGISDTVRLTVRPVVTRFTIPQPMLTLSAMGATAAASVSATDARGTAVSGAVIAYESSAPAVATVTTSGTVSATGAGTAFVRFQSGAARDSMRVTVTLPPTDLSVTSVALAVRAFSSDAVGDTLRLTATARTASGAVVATTITYRSLDPTIVMVGPTGAAWTMGPGTGRLVASVGTVADTARVTVSPVATTVRLNVTTLSLTTAGATATMVAAALDRLGTPVAATQFTWTSSAPAIASVSSAALVTAVSNGTATITATAGTLTAAATATVALPVSAPAALAYVSRTGTISAINDTLRVRAIVRDAAGAVMATVPTYRVIEQLYASVDAGGLVTERGTGTVHVVAAVGALTDTATLTLTQVATRISAARTVDSVTVGDSITPTFSAYDARGNFIATSPTLTTSAPGVARVSGTRVVGVTLGNTIVTASLNSVTAQSAIVVRAAPVILSVSALQNAVPGATATLTGRGFAAATALSVDGAEVIVPNTRSDTAMSFTMPATKSCDVDGRPISVRVNAGATAASGIYPLSVPPTWVLGIGESKIINAATGQCLVLPKGAGNYRLSVLNLDRGNVANSIFSYQTVVSQAASAALIASASMTPSLEALSKIRSTMARAALLKIGAEGDLVSATERPRARTGLTPTAMTYGSTATPGLRPTAGVSRSISGTTVTAFDPRLATAVVGDTVLLPDWFLKTSTQADICTMTRASVPVFKAVVYAINGSAVVLLDTRLTNAAQFTASGVQARFVQALGMVEQTSLPAIRSVIDPAYATPQGTGGRYFGVVTALPIAAAGTIWFAEGMPQSTCPNASGADFSLMAPTASGWDVGTIATVIDHERGHISDQRYAWKTGVATGLYGAQLTSTGWAVEAFASTVQEQAARTKLGVYQGADWNGISSIAPNVEWGIWPDPKHDLLSPWGATTTNTSIYGEYDLGSQYLTYARQLAGEGGSATPPAQTMFQRLAVSRTWSIDGVAAQAGRTGDQFLDEVVLALVTDDAVPAAQATRYSLPQFAYWNNSVQQTVVESLVRAFNSTHYWSTTLAVTGTETLAPGSFGYFFLPTDADKGQSVRLTMTSGAPASVIRLTRIR